MSPISSLIITQVFHSAEYIADIFRRKEIATVSRILLLPYETMLKNTTQAQGSLAIIDIYEWHDTEKAYSFISDLNSGIPTKIIHDRTNNLWTVSRNLNILIPITTNALLCQYVTEFRIDLENQYENEREQWRGTNLEEAFQMEI